jgi:hypothetical protein
MPSADLNPLTANQYPSYRRESISGSPCRLSTSLSLHRHHRSRSVQLEYGTTSCSCWLYGCSVAKELVRVASLPRASFDGSTEV